MSRAACASFQVRLGLRHRKLVGNRIDLEQQGALGDFGIFSDRDGDDPATHRRCHMDDIRIDRGIVRCRMQRSLMQHVNDADPGEGNHDQHRCQRATAAVSCPGGLHG